MKRQALRRFLPALLLSSLLLGGLTGCGSKTPLDPDNPVAINIWHYYNGPQKQAFDALLDEFNQTVGLRQGIIVEGFSHGSVTELIGSVLDAANKKAGAEDIPEVFSAYVDTAWEVDKMGLVAPLDEYLTEKELSEYRAEYIEEGRFDESRSLKIFPIAKSTEVLFLNRTDWDKFAAATGTELTVFSTVEGVTAAAKKYYEWTDSLTPAPDDGKALFGRDVMANYMLIGAMQLGSELYTAKGGKCVLNLDETLLRRLWDNHYVPLINGWFAAYGRFRSDDAKTGDVISFVGSTTGVTYFPAEVTLDETNSYPIEATILPLPRFEGGEPFVVQQGAGMVVTRTTPQKEFASTVFLKWFTEEERNIKFAVSSTYLPVKNSAAELSKLTAALPEMRETQRANMEAMFSVATKQMRDSKLYTPKAFENGNAARNILENSMGGRAKTDRESVLKLMESGLSHDEAVARYDTDENFSSWFKSFRAELESAVNP